jgi:hypothetical protein
MNTQPQRRLYLYPGTENDTAAILFRAHHLGQPDKTDSGPRWHPLDGDA